MSIKTTILTAFLLFFTATLFCQYRISPIPIPPTIDQREQLSTKLQTYSLYTIPSDQLSDWLSKDEFDLQFTVAGETISWSITRNSTSLSPSFTAELHSSKGVKIMNDELLLLAYRGYLPDESKANVAMTYTNLGLELNYIDRGTGTVRFASLYNLTYRKEDKDVYILYRYADAFAMQSTDTSCKLGEEDRPKVYDVTPGNDATPDSGKGNQSKMNCQLPIVGFDSDTETTTSCRIFQIAVDGDEEFSANDNDGSGLTTFSRMFNNIMAAELPYFNEVDVSFQITRIRTYGGIGSTGDPHPDDDFFVGNSFFFNRAEDYVDDLVTLNAGATPHDYVFGFTGVVSRAATTGGVLWGISNGIGTACSNNSASGLATQEAFDDGIAAVNTAHEIGHGYDALHPYGGQCINECSPGGGANSFMCRTACAAVGTQSLNVIAAETQNAWTNFVNGEGPCFDNTDVGTLNGPETVCSSATYNWDAENVASGSIWTFPSTSWSVGPGLQIDNSSAYNATVSSTTTLPKKSWVRMTLNQATGCPIVLTKEVVVNAMPAFCLDNDVCSGFFEDIVDGETLPGTTISNIQCAFGNCNSLNISSFGGGGNQISVMFSGPGGFYGINYTLTNSCGTTTGTFYIDLQECFHGGSGKEEYASSSSGTKAQAVNEKVDQTFQQDGNYIESIGLSAFPNPVNNMVNINFQAKDVQQTNLLLVDGQGRKVRNLRLDVVSGRNQVELELDDLPSGVYTIITLLDGNAQRLRLVKQ